MLKQSDYKFLMFKNIETACLQERKIFLRDESKITNLSMI